mmetsp:Transcript_16409/g.39382  ORF Transcript_16409/g.39382 Transcript_16409/m.39382 type:complete len:215 (-) Transcript_16409:215-859(-)
MCVWCVCTCVCVVELAITRPLSQVTSRHATQADTRTRSANSLVRQSATQAVSQSANRSGSQSVSGTTHSKWASRSLARSLSLSRPRSLSRTSSALGSGQHVHIAHNTERQHRQAGRQHTYTAPRAEKCDEASRKEQPSSHPSDHPSIHPSREAPRPVPYVKKPCQLMSAGQEGHPTNPPTVCVCMNVMCAECVPRDRCVGGAADSHTDRQADQK